MKTLWAATGIFILSVNESILIVSLRAWGTLPPDWVNELQLEMLAASDKHLVSLWVTKYLRREFNLGIYMEKRGLHIYCKTFTFLVYLTFLVHCGIHCKQRDHTWIKWFAQMNHFSLFSAFDRSARKSLCSYSTCIKSVYPFGFKCNSWKAQNKRGNSGVARCRLINKITNDMNCPKMTLK